MFIYSKQFVANMSNDIKILIIYIKNMYEYAIIYTIISLGEGWSINF